MRYHGLKKVLYSALIGLVAAASLGGATYFSTPKAQADLTKGIDKFGGQIITPMPAIPCPFISCPPCPPHTLILDYSSGHSRLMGLMVYGPAFDNNNITTPSVANLGQYDLIPFPPCFFMPYMVFFPFFNPTRQKIQMGTGAGPRF